jgi:lactoylglutathione lyase
MTTETVPQTARLGWVIVYVPSVEHALTFYEEAFGLRRTRQVATFGQLDTGGTALAFASYERADAELPGGFERPRPDRPCNVEICLVFDNPYLAFDRAVDAGCTAVAAPEHKPHGQIAGFVRDPYGTLVEIASPPA